jgi:hypothetical protein
LTLDATLRRYPDWQDCAVHCCHCGIRFFTHPRNAGRQDLRCPFGCREHHRRQCANARSRKHNQTPEGRANKKKLNIAARLKAGQAASRDTALPASVEPSSQLTADSPRGDCSEATTVDAAPPVEVSPALLAQLRLNLDGFVLDESTLVNSRVLPYVRMVVSVLEGRTIGREQLLVALRKRIRQRSIGRLSRREYVLHYLQQHPP